MSEMEYALGAYCGITFAGIKTASLVRVKRSELNCLGCLAKFFRRKGFGFVVLKMDKERALLYVYNVKKLKKVLLDKENKAFLTEQGYCYKDEREAIGQLKERLEQEEFPHEIGIFLGYPLEDVKGFINHPCEGVQAVGCWKVYANAEEKQKLFERFRRCSASICCKMQGGKSLMEIFEAI
ncbi:MAG: DUF3793 family protein [Clostridia bacterium]|nr:DUF3793 family protein [Clostridia bacterium]